MTVSKTKVEQVIEQDVVAKELNAECDYIGSVLTSRTKRGLYEDYSLGCKVKALCENPKVFGTNAMFILVKRLKTYETFLYAIRSFATSYEQEEVDELIKLPTSNGRPFPWTIGHIRLLCQLPKARRKVVQADCAKKGMSMRELASRVKKELPDKVRPKGKPPQKPKNLEGFIDLFASMASTWVDRVDRFQADFMEAVKSKDDCKALQKKLLALEALTEAVSERAASMVVALSENRKKKARKATSYDAPMNDWLESITAVD